MDKGPPAGKLQKHRKVARGAILLAVCTIALFMLLDSRRSVSANNDAFLQILAAEGMLKNEGYGFFVEEKYVSLGDRALRTRWPPGLTVVASALWALRLAPLETLSAMLPYLGALSLLVMTYLLSRGLRLQLAEANVVALAVVGTGAFFDWHGEVGTEPFFFLLLLSTLLSIAISGARPTGWTLGCFWACSLFRTAAAFLAPGLSALYGVEGRSKLRFVVRSALACAILLAPIVSFHVYYGLRSKSAGDSVVGVIPQLGGQLFWLHEVLFPHTTLMKSHRLVGELLGGAVLAVALFCGWRCARRAGSVLNPVTAGCAMGTSYMVLLTVSAWVAGYDWANVYRVGAVHVVLIGMAFWAGLLACADGPWVRQFVFIAAILAAACKFSFVVFRQPNPAFQKDYRATVSSFSAYATQVGLTPVALCASDSFERNVSYGIFYAAKRGVRFPVPVRWMAFGDEAGDGVCHFLDRNTGQWSRRRSGSSGP